MAEENEEQEVSGAFEHDTFKLSRGMRGTYGWEIKIVENNFGEMKKRVKERDDWARKEYGGTAPIEEKKE